MYKLKKIFLFKKKHDIKDAKDVMQSVLRTILELVTCYRNSNRDAL